MSASRQNYSVVQTPLGGKRLIVSQVDESLASRWDSEKPAHLVLSLQSQRVKDLDFLAQACPDVQDLTVLIGQTQNAEAIDRLENLRSLSFQGGSVRKGPSLSGLTKLSDAHLRWWDGCQSVFSNPSLVSLGLFDSKWEALPSFSNLVQLQGFSLSNCRGMNDLSALSSAPSLRQLSLAMLPKVTRLDVVQRLQELVVLWISSLRQVEDFSPLGSLAKLRILMMQSLGGVKGMSAVGQCRDLVFLDFVGSHPEDLNLDFLDSLEKLRGLYFENKRGYSRKRESFPAWGKGVDLPSLEREMLGISRE